MALEAKVTLDDTGLGQVAQRVQDHLKKTGAQFRQFQQDSQRAGDGLGEAGEAAGGVARKFGGFRQGAQQVGFLLNDLQQFSFGAAQGIRAISNNLTPLIATMKLSSRTMGFLIIAVEAAATALSFFLNRAKEAKQETDALTESQDALAEAFSSVITISTGNQKVRLSVEQAQAAMDSLTETLLEQRARMDELAFSGRQTSSEYTRLKISTAEIDESLRLLNDRLTPAEAKQKALARAIAITGVEATGPRGTKAFKALRTEVERIATLPPNMDALNTLLAFIERMGKDAGERAFFRMADGLIAAQKQLEAMQAALSRGEGLRGAGPRPTLNNTLELAPDTLEAISVARGLVQGLATDVGDIALAYVDWATGTITTKEALRELGDIAKGVFRRIIADITTATVKMALFRSLASAFPGGSFLGAVFGSLVGGGSGRAVAQPARLTATSVVEGRNLRLIVREENNFRSR